MKFELLTAPQGDILGQYIQSRARIAFIKGPLGSGKTFASCEKVFKYMCNQKPNGQNIRKSRWYAIRNTYPDLLSTTVKDWMELFGDLGRYKGGGIEPPSHTLRFRLRDKSIVQTELIFLALDRPQSIKKLRGSQVTGFWLNETKELDKAIIDMADLRHGRYPSPMDGGPSWHGMIGDTNAPDDDSWYYEMSEEEKPEGWEFFHQPGGVYREMVRDELGQLVWTGKWLINEAAENLHNLPKDYYVAGLQGKSDSWIAVNLANEYGTVMDGIAIYEEQWLDTLHMSDTIQVIPNHPICIGFDFGLTPAAIVGQETPNGTINILHEIVGIGMGIKQFVKGALKPVLNAHYRNNPLNFVGDPAGNRRADTDEETVFKVLNDLGMPTDAANTNDPTIRWEAVKDMLQQLRDGRPAFQVHKRCKMLRKGFNGGYKFRRVQVVGESRYHDKADKNKYSHPHDALQYLMMWFRGDSVPTTGFERPADDDSGWAM